MLGSTFGNAALCIDPQVPADLEIKLRGVGRLALEADEETPNRVVQGDMVWV